MQCRKTISFFLTEFCNQKCEYCDIPTIKEPKGIDIKNFKKYMKIINQYTFQWIFLSGGEVGTIDVKDLDIVFSEIKDPIILFTNGLFIQKKYLDRYRNKIDIVHYHINTVNQEIPFTLKNQDSLVYIITAKNYDQVPKIYEAYKQYPLYFKIYTHKRVDRNDLVVTNEIFQELETYNIYIEELESWKKFKNLFLNNQGPLWNKLQCHVAERQIDFVRNRTLDCCISHVWNSSKELTEENLIKVIETTKAEWSPPCDSCIKKIKDSWHVNLTIQKNICEKTKKEN